MVVVAIEISVPVSMSPVKHKIDIYLNAKDCTVFDSLKGRPPASAAADFSTPVHSAVLVCRELNSRT